MLFDEERKALFAFILKEQINFIPKLFSVLNIAPGLTAENAQGTCSSLELINEWHKNQSRHENSLQKSGLCLPLKKDKLLVGETKKYGMYMLDFICNWWL